MALDFVAGCLGGCAGVLVGHPFDTVKVNLQTQDYRNPQYRGTFHCLRTIVARDSVRGLYRGMASPMAGVAFVNAIVFGVYGNVQRRTENPNSLISHFMAGSAAGLAQSIVCSPMELIKTRLQLQTEASPGGRVKFKGPLDCLLHIWRHEGLRGVYRGLGITAARDLPGFSSYFVSYELMTRKTPNPSAFHTLMAGGLAGTFSWICTFPLDVVKSRIQADEKLYKGIADCVVKSYRAEGISFLTRGLASTLIRAFPMNAACFLVVSSILNFSRRQETQGGSLQLQITPPTEVLPIVSYAPQIFIRRHDPLHHHETRHRNRTIRNFVVLAAFQEAICDDEITELINDTFEEHNGGYYLWDTGTCLSSSLTD
ncbi:mitochondrial basic amino acids transporter [Lutzomyia longipalpis]|uniref:mitochondrial basic amino acids transporter n=1 Tax=Lutzomyia longipalpis TaxID=7200 RepID=UPI00248390B3|nr:mitochondrial basic amino acids transporter [Lutzomyia longipalpis]